MSIHSYQRTRERFERFKADGGEVLSGIDEWRQAAIEFVLQGECAQSAPPESFWSLTDLLMAWCDLQLRAIDPSVLDELRRRIGAAGESSGRCGPPQPRGVVEETLRRALSVLERMEYATMVRMADAPLPKPPMEYGPDPFNAGVFFWDGRARSISKESWELLLCIWKRDEAVPFFEIGESMEGEISLENGAIEARIDRLNRELSFGNYPLRWSCADQQVELDGQWPD